jgi:vancomycin resistance protein YoaR
MSVKTDSSACRLVFPAVTALTLLLLVVADYFFYRDRIYPGVYLYGINTGSLHEAEARQLVQEELNRENLAGTFILFRYGEKSWSYTLQELGVALDWAETLAGAFAAGRKRMVPFSYAERIRMMLKPVQIPLKFTVDPSHFSKALAPAAQYIDSDPQEARFELAEDAATVEIIPEKQGLRLLLEETRHLLEISLETYPVPESFPLLVRELRPARTAATLRELRVRAEVSAFSTQFALTLPGRVHNIRLASSLLDGILLEPGGEFSFNKTVGKTGSEQGYQPAPVIIAGEIVEGFGGGVCQVSSTLYNAVLLAGLQVVARTGHSLAVGYVPPGRDAAVAYGWQDLKFRNSLEHGIWIRTFVKGERLTVRLFGDPVPGQEIRLLNSDLDVIPRGTNYIETDNLPAGTQEKVRAGQDGYRVSVWRVTSLDGAETGRELLSRDYYRAVPAEVRVGTGVNSLR